MTEILWLGRGGQGAFTAAKLLGAAYAAKGEDFHALAFPSFGPERRGAPVRAFTKLDGKPILDRSETEKADYIIILDETLYNDGLCSLLKEGGKILINSKTSTGENIIAFDGNALAAELKLPTANTVMLGTLSAVSGTVSAEEINFAVDNYMPERIREKNKLAIGRAIEGALK
ncbi:MAG: 2-oxoacid:acceptor oxidoreductase family protein [Oscillospiraceae bacterium]|nr:2-oxoacid:acceptor oxidoreductase family protein [Oscillospiraceae bacterium]